MIRRNLLRCAAVAVLGALLLAPAAATAAPIFAAQLPTAPGRALFAALWDLLGALMLGDTTDTGGCIDPNGRDLCAGAAAGDSGDPGGDTRGTIDPDG